MEEKKAGKRDGEARGWGKVWKEEENVTRGGRGGLPGKPEVRKGSSCVSVCVGGGGGEEAAGWRGRLPSRQGLSMSVRIKSDKAHSVPGTRQGLGRHRLLF